MGHTCIVELLANHGADINTISDGNAEDEGSPIQVAILVAI